MSDVIERARALVVRANTAANHRVAVSAVLSMALFTVIFWLMVAAGRGAFEPRVEDTGEGFPRAVMTLYFVVSLIGAPLAVATVGTWVDRRTAHRSRDDAVLVFAALGVLLAAPPVLVLAASEPEGAAWSAAIWLLGVPIVLASALTRFFVRSVVRSPGLSLTAASVALLPPLVTVLFLLGLYVARGSGAT